MNTKPLVFAVGLLTAGYAALTLPGCGGNDEAGGGTGGSAGKGGSSGSTGGSDSSATGGSSTGGSSGSGGSGEASTSITCGTQTCQSTSTFAQPCCAGTAQDKCGVAFSAGGSGCQELNQPGSPSQSCTDALLQQFIADAGIEAGVRDGGRDGGFQFEGCCRPDGTCGALVNFAGVNLGCVDVSRFLDGGTVPTCTP